MTTPPVAMSDFVGWVPLGAMNPPGHTFPTDHQYIYVNDPGSTAPRREVPVVAPGEMTITFAKRQTVTPNGVTDYSLSFSLCAEVSGEFGHVASIAPAVLQQIGNFDKNCTSYSPAPGSTASTCEASGFTIKLHAGDVIGTTGGPPPHSFGLDVSLWDSRVPPITYANPARWQSSSSGLDHFHVVPASDYFAEPARSQIGARLGSFNGTQRRTASPIGGTIGVDVPGTAMGAWFNPSQPTYPEFVHLAIAPDNVDPSQMQLSVGTTLSAWTRGLVSFTPVSAGYVNRHPAQITADGRIYCFESAGSWAMIVQLVDASTLRVEVPSATSCAAAPAAFSGGAVDFRR
jgi:hypothetical protein